MNWLFYSIKIKLVIFNERLINLPLQILKEMIHHTMPVRSTQNGHKLCLIASFAFLESSSTSTERLFHAGFMYFKVHCCGVHMPFTAQGIPRDCLKAVLLFY